MAKKREEEGSGGRLGGIDERGLGIGIILLIRVSKTENLGLHWIKWDLGLSS